MGETGDGDRGRRQGTVLRLLSPSRGDKEPSPVSSCLLVSFKAVGRVSYLEAVSLIAQINFIPVIACCNHIAFILG